MPEKKRGWVENKALPVEERRAGRSVAASVPAPGPGNAIYGLGSATVVGGTGHVGVLARRGAAEAPPAVGHRGRASRLVERVGVGYGSWRHDIDPTTHEVRGLMASRMP